MSETLHAVALIALPIACLLLLLAIEWREEGWPMGLLHAAIGVLLAAVVYYVFASRCAGAGDPFRQAAIIGTCLVLGTLLPGNLVARWTAFGVCLVALVLLLVQYETLVRGGELTSRRVSSAEELLPALREELTVLGQKDGGIYPEGRIEGQVFVELLPRSTRDRIRAALEQGVVRPLWHTRLTGLYRVDRTRRVYWFLGGGLKENGRYLDLVLDHTPPGLEEPGDEGEGQAPAGQPARPDAGQAARTGGPASEGQPPWPAQPAPARGESVRY